MNDKPKRKKPLGRAVDLPEAETDEAATPNAQDIERARALAKASGSDLAAAIMDAGTYEGE